MYKIDYPFKEEVLACGAQSQAGFCLAKKNCAYVINDFGSLNDAQAHQRYQQEIERVKKELKLRPKIIAHDLYPEYCSTKYAESLSQKSKGLKCLAVQHQKAHLASCLGENGLQNNKVIGVAFDGQGFGEDANIWGGEFFLGGLQGFQRMAHLKYIPAPALGQADYQPGQLAANYLFQAFGEKFVDLEIDFVRAYKASGRQIFKPDAINCCYSSSMAGFFDAVWALVGLNEKMNYDGQGVAGLERIVNRSSHAASKGYEFSLKQQKGEWLISPEPIFQEIVQDLGKNISKSIISTAFHNTVVEITRQLCQKIRQEEKVKDVLLTGTVFLNKFLFKRLNEILTAEGFKIITHKHFSCADNNISFGQAVLADGGLNA